MTHLNQILSHIVIGDKTGCDLNVESTKWIQLESKPDFVKYGTTYNVEFRVGDIVTVRVTFTWPSTYSTRNDLTAFSCRA